MSQYNKAYVAAGGGIGMTVATYVGNSLGLSAEVIGVIGLCLSVAITAGVYYVRNKAPELLDAIEEAFKTDLDNDGSVG